MLSLTCDYKLLHALHLLPVSLIAWTRDLTLSSASALFMTLFPVSQLQHNPVFISRSLVVIFQIMLNSEYIKPHSLSFYQYLLGVWGRLWGEGFLPKLFLLLRSIPRNLLFCFIFIQMSNAFQVYFVIPLSYHDQDPITQYILLFQLLPRWSTLYYSHFKYCIYRVIPLTKYPRWPLYLLLDSQGP